MFSTIKIEKKGELHREHRFHGPIKATNINSQILFMKRKKEKKNPYYQWLQMLVASLDAVAMEPQTITKSSFLINILQLRNITQKKWLNLGQEIVDIRKTENFNLKKKKEA